MAAMMLTPCGVVLWSEFKHQLGDILEFQKKCFETLLSVLSLVSLPWCVQAVDSDQATMAGEVFSASHRMQLPLLLQLWNHRDFLLPQAYPFSNDQANTAGLKEIELTIGLSCSNKEATSDHLTVAQWCC